MGLARPVVALDGQQVVACRFCDYKRWSGPQARTSGERGHTVRPATGAGYIPTTALCARCQLDGGVADRDRVPVASQLTIGEW